MKLKICGMKYNTEEIAALEPDYLGFIFWEPSSRFFNGSIPKAIHGSKKVGVFVDATLEEVVLRVLEYELNAIQLHGKEDPEYCRILKTLLTVENSSRPEIIKAFAIDEDFDFETVKSYEAVCDYFLFDTRADLPGGTGRTFNWQLLKNNGSKKPYFLSGGIGATELTSLKEFLKSPESRYCYAIDVNSKFEKEPGRKDKEALENFMIEMGFESKNDIR